MFNHSSFNHATFNAVSDSSMALYATIQAEYELTAQIRSLIHIGEISFTAESTLQPERFGVYVPLDSVTIAAESNLSANLTALIPLGAIHFAAEYTASAVIRAKISIGETVLAQEHTMEAVLWTKVPLGTPRLAAEFALQDYFKVLVPFAATTLTGEYGGSGRLWAKMPMEATVPAEYGLIVTRLRNYDWEEFDLEGLNLAPGETLVVDTDSLTIEVDNEVRVDCWVTGGTFFPLKPGNNILNFTDNATSRNLAVTIIWADRYL